MSSEFRKARRGLREIVAESEKAQLGRVLAEWDYVRPLLPDEAELGVWFAFGDDGLFWFVRDSSWQPLGEVTLHVCAAPAARGEIATRWVLTAIEVIACLLGQHLLYAPDNAQWGQLLRRVGWREAAPHEGVRYLALSLPRVPGWLGMEESDGGPTVPSGEDGRGPGRADARGLAE